METELKKLKEVRTVPPIRIVPNVANFKGIQTPMLLIAYRSMQTMIIACLMFSEIGRAQETSGTSKMPKIDRVDYGMTPAGEKIDLYTLTNSNGNYVKMTNYGAILVGIFVPDRRGERANVTLGFDKLEGYLQRHPYFGATVGRYANRIAKGQFSIDGQNYSMVINNGPNHLHGGTVGFDKLVWKAETLPSDSSVGLRFTVRSPDGQEGYPGNLDVVADYLWDNDSRLTIRLSATTDKPTHLNLTNHAYFNLGGWKGGKIYDTQLELACSKYLPVDDGLIPTGTMADVEGTPLDFRVARKLGERIQQLPATQGYDHCLVVDGEPGKLRTCAKAIDPHSGRAMMIETTQPGVQLYTGNFLAGSESTGGFGQHEAFCLETQHFPDSPNKPQFPSTLLRPGQVAQETTTIQFFTVQ